MSESQNQSNAIRAAAAAAVSNQKRDIPKEVTLSNGIVLKVKPMPPLLLNTVANSIPEPPIPKVWIEDKDREEENPNHPSYIKALEQREIQLALATNNLILYACTEVSHIPDGIWGPDNDEWIIIAKMAGIDFEPEDKVQRYLAWIKCYAMATTEDMEKAMTVPLMLAGITEGEVQEVLDTFRSREGRETDPGIPVEQPGKNGNNVPNRPTRSRSRT